MTKRRELKQRVRARMAKTGERYTTALRHFQSTEQVELEAPFTEFGIEGLACRVRWWKNLGAPTAAWQAELTQALRAVRGEPAAVLFTRAAFGGQASSETPPATSLSERLDDLSSSVERFASGVRGFSRDGRRLALDLGGATVMLSVLAGNSGALLAVTRLETLVALRPQLGLLKQAIATPVTDFAGLRQQFERARAPEVIEASGLVIWLG
jgi:hypothetical protein